LVEAQRHGNKPAELDGAAGPAGGLAGQVVEQRERPLAAAVADRVRQLAAADEEAVLESFLPVATPPGSPASWAGW